MNYDYGDDHLATPTEACREFARNVGAECPEREWISTPFDSWERNPFYRGHRHVDPETAGDMYSEADKAGETLTEEDLREPPINVRPSAPMTDDDIPF